MSRVLWLNAGLLLAQQDVPGRLPSSLLGWVCAAVGLLSSGVFLLYAVFWFWMLIDCISREPDRFFWVWLLIIVPFPGAVVYAMLRYFPQRDFVGPRWLRALFRGKELARLEAAAEQIGNPHQFIQWGDALRETGQLDRARRAYEQALAKDPAAIQALWGAAQVAIRQQRPTDAADLTRQILKIDPQYKFGDVSLAYGRALKDLGETAEMRTHFEQHVRRWRHPEAVYLLAEQCQADGEPQTAREHLQSLLRDLQTSPTAVSRKFGRWRSRAQKLLRQLPAPATT